MHDIGLVGKMNTLTTVQNILQQTLLTCMYADCSAWNQLSHIMLWF